MINYNNKRFKLLSSSDNSEVSTSIIFNYKQDNNLLTCNYSGDQILSGHLMGIVESNGHINMRYHQVNKKNVLMTGICYSKPEIMASGKIRLHENWQWTSGDLSKGESVLEEI
ncbi:n-acetylglutamate synthase [uncultured Algibacter sp.]|uniref:n-acetylglutamate synthase n=1 Tax=uncultured Algibacter sp. TaxID=298659 RepID=UPI00261F933C|nr:n-acetylglutamate synthase [uncultured Algibacter sp.]